MKGVERILPLAEAPLAEVLALLDDCLGPGHDAAWFEWKHRGSPFGPSLGWVAMDSAGPVGVRLLLRWRLRTGDRTLSALRPVDTATAPRARRQGIFRRLTETAWRAAAEEASADLLFNNPNRHSLPGYLDMGWSDLGTIRRGWTPAPALGRGTAEIALDAEALAAFGGEGATPGIATDRSLDYLAWRYSPPGGSRYSIARLRHADRPNAIVYRVARRRLPILVVCELTAQGADRRALLAAACRQAGARVALTTVGAGAVEPPPGLWLRRGGTRLVARALRETGLDVEKLASWALALGDLEGIL